MLTLSSVKFVDFRFVDDVNKVVNVADGLPVDTFLTLLLMLLLLLKSFLQFIA